MGVVLAVGALLPARRWRPVFFHSWNKRKPAGLPPLRPPPCLCSNRTRLGRGERVDLSRSTRPWVMVRRACWLLFFSRRSQLRQLPQLCVPMATECRGRFSRTGRPGHRGSLAFERATGGADVSEGIAADLLIEQGQSSEPAWEMWRIKDLCHSIEAARKGCRDPHRLAILCSSISSSGSLLSSKPRGVGALGFLLWLRKTGFSRFSCCGQHPQEVLGPARKLDRKLVAV